MVISIVDLKKLSSIEKVIIHSHDQSLYLVSVIIDDAEHYVVDKNGKPLKAFNKLELQAIFDRHSVGKMVLRQQSPYDEMVGQPLRDGDNTLEVPLGNRALGGRHSDKPSSPGGSTFH